MRHIIACHIREHGECDGESDCENRLDQTELMCIPRKCYFQDAYFVVCAVLIHSQVRSRFSDLKCVLCESICVEFNMASIQTKARLIGLLYLIKLNFHIKYIRHNICCIVSTEFSFRSIKPCTVRDTKVLVIILSRVYPTVHSWKTLLDTHTM